jgi:hypothetical protein
MSNEPEPAAAGKADKQGKTDATSAYASLEGHRGGRVLTESQG